MTTVETDVNYWDCECVEDYIHPKSVKVCFECNTVHSSQPDSRANEVQAAIAEGWLKPVMLDVFGNALEVGDTVACIRVKYLDLHVGKITSFGERSISGAHRY